MQPFVFFIFSFLPKENIFLGDAVDEAEYERLVQLVELEKLKERNLGSGGEHISGGEKQRLALARFLYQLTVKNKAFFIIDEAFVSLDFYTKEKMLALTTEAVKGKTGICITHDDAVFQALGDKVLLCNKENKLVLKDKIKGKNLKDYLDAE